MNGQYDGKTDGELRALIDALEEEKEALRDEMAELASDIVNIQLELSRREKNVPR